MIGGGGGKGGSGGMYSLSDRQQMVHRSGKVTGLCPLPGRFTEFGRSKRL